MKFLVVLAAALSLVSCDDRREFLNDIENESSSIKSDNQEIEFPRDHRLHTNINEWYYFSGVVETPQGRQFGLMFTIFQLPDGQGGFVYPSMMGVADVRESQFTSGYELPNVWKGQTGGGLPLIFSKDATFLWLRPNRLFVRASVTDLDGTNVSIILTMKATKDILLHGENGFIPMGDNIPSGYYSLTNLKPTAGILSIGNDHYPIVDGRIWMDHQWGDWTAAGYRWDWFALRFDDGGALMLFQFRDENQEPSIGNWTYRDKDGNLHYGTDFVVEAKRMIGVYPIDWEISLPSLNASFEVKPLLDDQIFPGFPTLGWDTLWEGLCDVSGYIGETQLTGQAFVELNEY